jgi:hypothetical protein
VVLHDVIGAMLRSGELLREQLVNGTIEPILEMVEAKAVFYGIHIAGVARLRGLDRFMSAIDVRRMLEKSLFSAVGYFL